MQTTVNKPLPAVPPINKLMQVTAVKIAITIKTLTDDGFTVIGIEFSSGSKPTIQVQNCPACGQLVERGKATYYRMGGAGMNRYRTGQFQIDGIRVLWTERGH